MIHIYSSIVSTINHIFSLIGIGKGWIDWKLKCAIDANDMHRSWRLMATIKDVAKRAGVSPSTVSRVIADNARISPATKKKVRSIMKALNYHPNMMARSLIRRTSQTLGLILSRPAESAFLNPFFPEVIRGISSVAQRHHYRLMLATAESHTEESKECLQMLGEKQVDGVVLLGSRVNDQLIYELINGEYPFVVVGRAPEMPQAPTVNNDNIQAAYTAVRHLLQLGRRRVGLLNGPEEFTFCQDRYTGYCFAHREFGLEPNPSLIRNGSLTQEDGYLMARSLLSNPEPPSAIFAVDDIMALGIYRAAREAGLHIPKDLAVVGFNDDPLATIIEPALTTIRIPIYKMGVAAAELLLDHLANPGTLDSHIILSSELIIRHSCGIR